MDPTGTCLREYPGDASSASQCEQQIRSFDGNYTYLIAYYTELDNNLTRAYSRVNFVPTIYDEVDFFKNAIDYPFQMRKNEMPRAANDYGSTSTLNRYNIVLRKNTVCYDKHWYSQLFFWSTDEYCDVENQENFEYSKLQFSKNEM